LDASGRRSPATSVCLFGGTRIGLHVGPTAKTAARKRDLRKHWQWIVTKRKAGELTRQETDLAQSAAIADPKKA
jgi:hypothetical protein